MFVLLVNWNYLERVIMNDIYKRYTELEEENYQLETINTILWEYISDKDIPEIDKKIENI